MTLQKLFSGKQPWLLVLLLLVPLVVFAQTPNPSKLPNPAKPLKSARGRMSKRDELVTITTSVGVIQLILFSDTPLHRGNFLARAKAGRYDGTTFHRVIPGFMVQGGDPNSLDNDPNNDGQGPANEPMLAAEIRPGHAHVFGAMAAARTADFVNPQRQSSVSQFYLVENRQGARQLDGQYTVFGQVIQGLDVLEKIAALPRDARDRPLTDLKMTVTVQKLKKKKISQLYGYAYPAL